MARPKRHSIYIYDHPESKIRFLEQTLAEKDWRATLVYPDKTPEEQQHLLEAQQAFEKRGYQVKASINEFGQHVLEIHHLGDGSEPSDLVQEMGLARGIGHMIANPSIPVGAALHKLGGAFDYAVKTVKDPAHLNGLIYTSAEAVLFFSGKNKKTEVDPFALKTPGKFLRRLGFGLFLAQSLTYLFAAKNNDETSFEEFKNKIGKSIKKGNDLTQVHYDNMEDKPGNGAGHTLVRMLRRYPIEAGALFNNLGMVFYIFANYKDRRFASELVKHSPGASKKAIDYLSGGFRHDMGGALTSIAAWFLMLIKPKKKPEYDMHESTKNPFARVWDGLRENPQIGTGLLTLAASSQRLLGAGHRDDHIQKFGESIYLFGDVMLLFTRNDHYGKKTGNVDTLADALAGYINKMPLILGPTKQQEMVKNMADFLLQKGLAEIKYHPKTASFTPEELKERADLMVLEVGRRVKNSYCEQMEQLGDITARLIAQFPADKHPALVEQLSQTLSKFSWIYATPDELKPVLTHSLNKRPPTMQQAATTTPTLQSLRQPVGDIAGIMEEVKDASSVSMLYDALMPFMAPEQQKQQAKAVPSSTVTHASRVAPLIPQAASATLAHA